MKARGTLASTAAAIAAAAIALSACGDPGVTKKVVASRAAQAPQHFSVVAVQSLNPEGSVPAPATPVLDLTGRISNTNGETGLTFDFDALESMRLVEGSIFEPFVRKETIFAGVLLSDLLTLAGASSTASSVFVTALDDYTWTLPIDVARSGEVLLATRENDQPIPIEKGGPIRIVFSDDSVAGKNTDSWVWSVRGIEVR